MACLPSWPACLQFLVRNLLNADPLHALQPGWLAFVPDTPRVRALADRLAAAHVLFGCTYLGAFPSLDLAMAAADAASAPPAAAPAAAGAQRGAPGTLQDGSGRAGATAAGQPFGGGPQGGRAQRCSGFLQPRRLWAVAEFDVDTGGGGGPEAHGRDTPLTYSIRMDALDLPSTFSSTNSVSTRAVHYGVALHGRAGRSWRQHSLVVAPARMRMGRRLCLYLAAIQPG